MMHAMKETVRPALAAHIQQHVLRTVAWAIRKHASADGGRTSGTDRTAAFARAGDSTWIAVVVPAAAGDSGQAGSL